MLLMASLDADSIPLQSDQVYSLRLKKAKVIKVIANGIIDKAVKNITPADIISSINYFINLLHGVGNTDDIDHLG